MSNQEIKEDKYKQLKKEIKRYSEMYDGGGLVSTLTSVRVAITDLQEEVKSLNYSLELAIKALEEITIETDEGVASHAHAGIIAKSILDQIRRAET